MSRGSVITFVVLLSILLVGTVLFVRSDRAAALLCQQIERRAGYAIEGEVAVRRCEVRLSEREIILDDISVESYTRGLSATIDHIRVRFRSLRAIGDFSLDDLVVESPSVIVDLSAERLGDAVEEKGEVGCEIPDAITRLAALRVEDGAVEILWDEDRRFEARGVVAKGERRGGRQELSLSVDGARLKAAGIDESLTDLRSVVTVDPSRSSIALSRVSFSSEDLLVTLRGELTNLCDPVIEASVTTDAGLERVADLLSFPPSVLPVSGRLRLVATAAGPPADLEVEGVVELLEASFAPITIGDVKIEARASAEEILLDSVSGTPFGGPMEVEGRIALEEGLPADLEVAGENVSIAKLVRALGRPGSWADAKVSPSGSLSGTLHPLKLSGNFGASVSEFVLLERYVRHGPPAPGEALLALEDVHVGGDVSFDKDEIEAEGVRLDPGAGLLRVFGTFPLNDEEEMDVVAKVENLDLDAVGPIVRIDYGGELSGRVSLTGRYGANRVVADVEADDFVFSGLAAGRVEGRFLYDDFAISLEGFTGELERSRYAMDWFELGLDVKPEPALDLRVSMSEALLEEVIDAFMDFDEVAREFVGVSGRASGTFGVKGTLDDLDLSFNATASDGRLFDQPFRRGRGMGRIIGMERLELDELSFTLAEDDAIVLRGWADIGGMLALSLSAREVPSRSLFFGEEVPLTGLVSGDLVLEGEWDHPEGRGVGVLIESRLGDTEVPPARLTLRLDGDRLHASGHMVEDRIIGSGWIDLDEENAFEVDLEFDEPDVVRWFGAKEVDLERLGDLRILAAGRAAMRGLAPEPTSVEGEITVDRLEAAWSPPGWLESSLGGDDAWDEEGERVSIELSSDEPVDLRLVGGGLAVRHLLMSGSGISLDVSGVYTAAGELDLALHGDADLELLQELVPALEHTAGHVTVEAGAGGTLASPTLVGSARLREGVVRAEGLAMTLHELEGPISFSQTRVIINGLEGKLGSGDVVFDGELSLRARRPDSLNLAVSLDEVRLRIPEELESIVAGRLVIGGPIDELTMAGELEVLRGMWLAEIEMDQILPSFRRRVATVEPEVERDPLFNLDVLVTADDTIRLDSHTIWGRLAADLRVVGDDVRPGALGTLSVTEGGARFRGNDYTVTRGVIELRDRHSIEPWIDLQAETEIREYRVIVHVHGSPEDPRVSLSSDPALPETDLVTLATLGVLAQDTEAFGDALAAAAAADALFTMSGLDRHVREFIPENPIVRDPSVRITSGYSVRAGQVSPRLAFESSIFVEDLRLRYSAPIGLPGQKTQAEYRITDVMSAQAEWDTEGRRTTLLGNLGVDLKLRWEME